MAFTGNEDHDFPLATAEQWTANYRATVSGSETKAHYFGGAAIKAILDQEGCVGIRIYYALDDQGEKQLIIVGADADENDLYEGLIAERSAKCPPNCAVSSPLS